MKISKTSWMILAAGIFIVVLAGLGVTRSGQIKQQSVLSQELSTADARLANIQTTTLQAQVNELEEQLKEAESQVIEAKDRLRQTVISVDVADKFYEIAKYYDVEVFSITTTTIQEERYEDVTCSTISLSALVAGDFFDVIDFVIGLNNNYVTGFIRSIQVNNEEENSGNPSTTNVQMIVYSYEGN